MSHFSDVAATLIPGGNQQFAILNERDDVSGYDATIINSNGNLGGAFSDSYKLLYDYEHRVGNQARPLIFNAGQGHNASAEPLGIGYDFKFTAYDIVNNNHILIPVDNDVDEVAARLGGLSHPWGLNAINPAGRLIYHGLGGTFKCAKCWIDEDDPEDITFDHWSLESDVDSTGSSVQGNNLEFFPELDSVLHFNSGNGRLTKKGTNESAFSFVSQLSPWVGSITSYVVYNGIKKCVVIGGGVTGGDNRRFHVIRSDGSIEQLDDCPIQNSADYGIMVFDPITGDYLLYQKDIAEVPFTGLIPLLYKLDVDAVPGNQWTQLTVPTLRPDFGAPGSAGGINTMVGCTLWDKGVITVWEYNATWLWMPTLNTRYLES